GSVKRDQPIHGTRQQHARILVYEIVAMAMAGDQIKITFPQQMALDTAHDHGGIAFAHLWNQDADGKTARRARPAGGKTGTVVQFAGGGKNAFLGRPRYGIRHRSLVHDQGNRSWRQAKVVGQDLEGDSFGARKTWAS